MREASYALGVPKWKTILRIVIPTALSGIVSGIILAIARVIGETAPLMITAGFTASINPNFFSGAADDAAHVRLRPVRLPGRPGRGVPAALKLGGAPRLILIVMALNPIGRIIAMKFAPKTGR